MFYVFGPLKEALVGERFEDKTPRLFLILELKTALSMGKMCTNDGRLYRKIMYFLFLEILQ